MAESNVKVLNLTKTVNGKTSIITVTDTNGNYAQQKAGTNSIMGFDKNDKVTVTGDISVFTQDEIKNAFFNSYNTEDERSEESLKDLTKTNLEIKDGKISGDTSKDFQLGDLAKVANPQTVAAPTQTPTNPWQFIGSGYPQMNGQMPVINPAFSATSADLVKYVSNFLGRSVNSNFGQPSFASGAMDMNSNALMAKTVWDTLMAQFKVQPQANPFGTITPSQVTAPTTATAEDTAKAVISEGEITKDTIEIKDEKATKTAEVKENKPKSEIENSEYQKGEKVDKLENDIKEKTYTDKNGDKIVETYDSKNRLTKRIKSFAKDDFERNETENFSVIKDTSYHPGEKIETNADGNRVKTYKNEKGDVIRETYKDGKIATTVIIKREPTGWDFLDWIGTKLLK